MNHLQSLRDSLSTAGLDAVLLTHQANRFYITGFNSSGTDGAALITPKNAYYLTDSRYTEAAQRVLGQEFEILQTRAGRGYSAILAELIQKDQLSRVGFEDDAMTVAACNTYREKLPCELTAASELLRKLRQTKDPEEIQALTEAQRIAEKALTHVINDIRPGVSEREIAARLLYYMLHFGAEDKSFDPIVVSGPNGSLPHGVPSDRPLQSSEFITIDFGCIYHGYCSDMTRTFALEYATDEMIMVYQTVLDAQKAGIAAAKEGVTGKEVDAAARKVIESAGYGEYFGHSFGHGVGIEIHESPYAASTNDKPLPANAVISAEPGIYIPGKFGVRIEDVIVIKPDGSENLTTIPKELMIL